MSHREIIEIMKGEKAAMDTLVKVMSKVLHKADVVGDRNAPSFSMGIDQIKEGYIAFKRRGVRIRFITEIVSSNISFCKELMQYVELKHLNNVKGNMAVSESEYVATAILAGEAKPVTQTIYSNVWTILDQNRYFFENLWNHSIPAKQKIREIEEGIECEFFDVIYDYSKAISILSDITNSIKGEIRALLPTEEHLITVNNKGIGETLVDFSKNNDVILKIIMSKDCKDFGFNQANQIENINILIGSELNNQLLIVSNGTFLRMSFKGNPINSNCVEDFFELAIYSNNKKSVDLFKFMFDLLGDERKINEDLEKSDKLQKNFIDIAAHELRTPIQTITGLSSLLQSKKPLIMEKQDEIIQIIGRNAERLEKLTENLLYKTKIESHGLELHKESFDIIEKVSRVVDDIKNQGVITNDVKIIVKQPDHPIIVNADKIRLYEVLVNLLNNSINFTTSGTITISISLDYESQSNTHVRIEISDTGTGISQEVLPNLFTPFIVGSFGVGLGLYICKKIVESHGGKIWAYNNKNMIGATFGLSLPLTEVV